MASNDAVVDGRADAVNPLRTGTKAAAHYTIHLQPSETRTVVLRLSAVPPAEPFSDAMQIPQCARRKPIDFTRRSSERHT